MPLKNTWRERLKAELAQLRDHVFTLEHELERLQTDYMMRSFTAMISPIDCRHPAMDAYEKRRAAESENRMLKSVLFKQIRTGHQLIAEITGESAEDAGLALFSLPSSLINASKREIHDVNGRQFTRLGQIVEQTYSELKTIFQETALVAHKFKSSQPTLTTRNFGDHERIVLEGCECRLIAVDIERCVSAQRHALRKMTYDNYLRVDRFETNEPNANKLRLHSAHEIRGNCVQLAATVVSKQFVERDRFSIVWVAATTSDFEECDAFVDETGWLMLQRVSNRS